MQGRSQTFQNDGAAVELTGTQTGSTKCNFIWGVQGGEHLTVEAQEPPPRLHPVYMTAIY